MSRFFINRPIVAIVISVLTVIVGAITIVTLPVSLFPSIAPPEVQVQTTYVGADAQTVEQSVALQNQEPYAKLKFAFRYRKEYVQGCSCKAAEYVSPECDKKADAAAGGTSASQRQAAAASSWPSSTGGSGVGTAAPPPPVQSEQLPDAQLAPASPSDAGASNAGGWQTKMLNDGWTAVTRDKSLSAQFEHTLAVTETGYEIFTLSPKGWHKPPYE